MPRLTDTIRSTAMPTRRGRPVLSLTRKRAGKTVTRVIPPQAAAQTRAQVAEYQRFRGVVLAIF